MEFGGVGPAGASKPHGSDMLAGYPAHPSRGARFQSRELACLVRNAYLMKNFPGLSYVNSARRDPNGLDLSCFPLMHCMG